MNSFPSDDLPMTQEEAIRLFEPVLPTIAQSFSYAWNKWNRLLNAHDELGRGLSPRTRASYIHDNIWTYLQDNLLDTSGVNRHTKRGLQTLVIGERIVLRFKKLNKKLKASNIPTYQQHQFEYHQLPLEGVPQLLSLTAGYILDRLAVNIEDLAITCVKGTSHRWSYPIPLFRLPEIHTAFTIEPASDEAASIRTRQVRAKKKEGHEEGQTGTND